MSNRAIAIAVGALVVLFLLFNSFFVVNDREQAIVTRFGAIQAVHEEPGLKFKAPFSFAGLDNVQFIEDRLLRIDLDDIRVQTSGGRFYIVNAFITYSIEDAIRFRQVASGDLERAENQLRTRFEDAVRGVYGRRGFEAALSEARSEMMAEVQRRLEPEAQSLGLAVEDVIIRRTDLTADVSEQTYERMRAERLAEAERLRARGNEDAQRIRAIAERQVVEIESEAVRESEIIRGQGEGERNRIFAEAFGQDPDFFEFYRSMAAYRQALESGGTRMVLTPNSEFFRFFQDAGASPNAGSLPPVRPIQPANLDVLPEPEELPEGTTPLLSDEASGEDTNGASALPAEGDTEEALPTIEVPDSSTSSIDDTGTSTDSDTIVITPEADASTGTDLEGADTNGDATVTIVPVEPAPSTATQ